MKKLACAITTAALCATMAISASAAPVTSLTSGSNTDSAAVTGTYSAGSPVSTVYSVEIEWGSMEFTYTDAAKGTWNPETLTYDGATDAAWSCETDANKVTVTNHSNAAVQANLSFAGVDGVTAGFTKTDGGDIAASAFILESAEPTTGTTGTAQSNSAYLSITGGSLNSSHAAGSTIGTVTVTLVTPIGEGGSED